MWLYNTDHEKAVASYVVIIYLSVLLLQMWKWLSQSLRSIYVL